MTRNLRASALEATRSRKAKPLHPHSLVVLGVDPGTLVTGYGVVVRHGGSVRLLGCGTIKNGSSHSMPLRLQKIYDELQQVISRYHPDEFAIESAFYGKNAQSALKLGHARGVSILAAVNHQIPTAEYSPREVKKAVVGYGAASKEQVQYMVKSILHAGNSKMLPDASDALAIAICHLHRLTTPTRKHKDWKSFVASHPERVRA
jgi:crossover junction endodeoxyribonuclease RuvC